jgi:hypothetical protein
MPWAINNLTAPDSYTTASTLQNLPYPPAVNIDVANSAIYWQVQQVLSRSGLATEGTWQEETFMLPGSRSIYRPGIRGFRFRAAVPAASLPSNATQAQVTAEAVS